MFSFTKSRMSGKTLFLIFNFILLSTFLHSATINIPADYATIQAGIDASTNADTVLVQPGTYVENINYNGKIITLGSLFLTTQDTSYISSTIIDGSSGGSVVKFENYEHSAAVLCGFTIMNGSALYGGGVHCDNANPTIENVIITGNAATNGGGGISCRIASPVLENVTITGNTVDYYGGGINFRNNSYPSLMNVTISGNSAFSGGGISCYDNCNPSLENVTIAGNTASHDGGGIYCNYYSDPSLTHATITGNTASVDGGGIYCHQNSNPSLTNSILWNDSPQEIYILSGNVTVTYSTIQGGWSGTGNTTANPLFLNPANGDYHLQPTSPCIDTGDPASPLDPDCTIADMGAYYFDQFNGPVWYVSATGSDITGTGCEYNPFATIQHGIDTAIDTDTVLVQPGTYVESINYTGKLITVGSLFLTTHDPAYISSTIIDGDSGYRVVNFVNGENSSAVLCGFTITNGHTSYGAGVYCNHASPTLENLIVTDNTATTGGGGISCYICSPTLENVTITGNTASNQGGGIYCYDDCNPSLVNVTIAGNSAPWGGGLWSYSSNPALVNSIIWDNSTQAIHNVSGSVTVSYSDIQGSWAGTGNIDLDPLFVNPGNGDYHLQPTSPCIDAGDPTSPYDPDGTIADMGAWYFPQPMADFTTDITSGDAPLTVDFTDLSTQGSGVIDEWYWDFGDSNNSFLQNPNHEYQLPGIYSVSLTVTDAIDFTDTETKVDYITVYPTVYNGSVWHISTTGSDIIGNGSEQYPFATIQHGIDTSANTDTVLVQPGTYVENINYDGKLITVSSLFLTTHDPAYISSTIIDGNSSGSVVAFGNGENTNTVLCGFTITNGLNEYGGGIYCNQASPRLENVIITGNIANHGGGINCSFYSHPSLRNVLIINNSTTYTGGGICCSYGSNPILQNVTISGNSAINGGAISCAYSATPSLTNSILWNNAPPEIYFEMGGSITATYSDIEGGYTGTGNIDNDPLFADPTNGDYHLTETSPCIDAGDPTSPYDPDGTIADMGAYYFHQAIAPDPPQNVTVEIIGTDVHLSWDAVTGANSYKVYSSDDPYTGFVEDTSGSFAGESWSAPIGDVKKFYYVTASTETIRAKDSHSQDAYHSGRKYRRYDSNKLIKKKIK